MLCWRSGTAVSSARRRASGCRSVRALRRYPSHHIVHTPAAAAPAGPATGCCAPSASICRDWASNVRIETPRTWVDLTCSVRLVIADRYASRIRRDRSPREENRALRPVSEPGLEERISGHKARLASLLQIGRLTMRAMERHSRTRASEIAARSRRCQRAAARVEWDQEESAFARLHDPNGWSRPVEGLAGRASPVRRRPDASSSR